MNREEKTAWELWCEALKVLNVSFKPEEVESISMKGIEYKNPSDKGLSVISDT